ncbi:MAG: CRISPR-associated endoribonuclease Cas6 [Synergistaceae bacterium]|nr:CRISPR-associated endoribonuclease Cas6 [Synergistaceae bacterium]
MRLPVVNLNLFQALLYKLLPPERAAFLHDEGYRVDGRPMKLFAMSWPLSATRPRTSRETIEYDLPIRLVVSTPIVNTLDGFVSGAFGSEELHIGNTSVICESIEAVPLTVTSEEVRVRTLSPITCYSQMQRGDGRKYTVYFHPSSPDFSESVHNNLVRKFRALHPEQESQIPEGKVEIRPWGKVWERVAKFDEKSNFPIKGWEGDFLLKGPIPLLQVGLDCGLGAKNSGGWGCVIAHKADVVDA